MTELVKHSEITELHQAAHFPTHDLHLNRDINCMHEIAFYMREKLRKVETIVFQEAAPDHYQNVTSSSLH